MIIEDTEMGKLIKLTGIKDGTMYRNFEYGVLRYKYVDAKLIEKSYKDYPLSNGERYKKSGD